MTRTELKDFIEGALVVLFIAAYQAAVFAIMLGLLPAPSNNWALQLVGSLIGAFVGLLSMLIGFVCWQDFTHAPAWSKKAFVDYGWACLFFLAGLACFGVSFSS